ncbi:MAG: CehA/McbA family metallohydrolase, partial [Planctomycetes bacterium]|nr:CehA/McbA family metallohydrolase [Planctomycetota bacterium]
VKLEIRDSDNTPTTARLEFRDSSGRVYPHQAKRLAPDFFFHPQIYRTTGESIHLPPGEYDISFSRGPEYVVSQKKIQVPSNVKSHRVSFQLERWIFPRQLNWFSGDHHVHGGGCAHYESPTAGVTPQDMFRHQLGEDLNVGCVLTWGPCWYFQKQYFEGRVNELSKPNYQMRYDVEVSGFPSDHSGHLSLLRLTEDDYPGTKRTEEWPSWDLPILKWGKEQGGVVGFSHSGWGLKVETAELPNYVIPPFNSIGANEYIVDVVHGVVDFISSVDTPYVWELNIWYHTLNCGYRTRISGETDFPCIYGERVGLGRIYCKLANGLNFDAFCDAIRDGRSYVGDGLSHLIDFQVNGLEIGTSDSEIRLASPGKVKVSAKVAALLDPKSNPELRDRPYSRKPYWHIERARIGDSRTVPLEVIVNGYPVARKEILADGTLKEVSFDVRIDKSSWVALRILPSSHTNPVFVLVGGKPIRASRRSAQWCLQSVDQCWKQKEPGIRESERAAAREAYAVARTAYQKILAESEDD